MEVGGADWSENTEDGDAGLSCFALYPELVSWAGIPWALGERLSKDCHASNEDGPCVKLRGMGHVIL